MHSPQEPVVGGLFGLALPSTEVGTKSEPPFSNLCARYFLSARCAIYALARQLEPGAAWLPSYLCPTLLDPFERLGVPIRLYDAGPNFADRDQAWLAEVQSSDMVLIVHYFGFPNSRLPATELKERGAVIVEDASQGLFLKPQYPNSFGTVFSARKFLGVPDGGVLASLNAGVVDNEEMEPPPIEWWKTALAAAEMRTEFDQLGGENRWFPLFRRVEETFPVGLYRSSDLARTIIESRTDYDFVRNVRRENYLALAERLKRFALFPVLDGETVPLGFPVCVDASCREAVLESLYKHKIYPPVHWRLEGAVPEEFHRSHELSRRILTLICDQRYTTCDMARQADAFLSAVRSLGDAR